MAKEGHRTRVLPCRCFTLLMMVLVILIIIDVGKCEMSATEKKTLKDKVLEMFQHAYGSYMLHAYPADELMPLSCRGRYRGTEPSRGDVDDSLGNFTLSLIDALDTIALLGDVSEFERAVRNVLRDVSFDNDIVVSVFETNIRILGGLLGGHFMAEYFKQKGLGLSWYNNELVDMAKDIGYRLLPAFNTTTGIPYPRVNLKHGLGSERARTGQEHDTCTACAGSMILEFAALSRVTGEPIFEEKARKVMDTLWQQRHRASHLMGLVINIHNGDWVRREAGVGAGIDSYYEYVLKAYILLGDEIYLDRFNTHYDAVMKYISQGPLLLDVHMHKPQANSRPFMDSLLAFWPGLQVLKGDIQPAIETHEMLYQVLQRHNFLPEAFTTDFRVHWGQSPLRPEFLESTYFLYKATGDSYYLDVGKKVLENLEQMARVPCGFAAIKDVTYGTHEDQMDSYVLAETFKYLFLLFAEPETLILNPDDYLFTTEAHLFPLTLSMRPVSKQPIKIRREDYKFDSELQFISKVMLTSSDSDGRTEEEEEETERFDNTCPNTQYLFPGVHDYAHRLRQPLKDMVEMACPRPRVPGIPGLRATDFMAGNKEQLKLLRQMGIRLITMRDGRVQLLHTASEAASSEDAADGMRFMKEMIELSKTQKNDVHHEPMSVSVLSPEDSRITLMAGPAQFGYDLMKFPPIQGKLIIASPYKACEQLENAFDVKGHIVMLERGDCMFIDKARNLQDAGAVAGIVADTASDSSASTTPLFAMSGDGSQDISIPLVFLFTKEAAHLQDVYRQDPEIVVKIYHEKVALDNEEMDNNQESASQTPTCKPIPPQGPTQIDDQQQTHQLPESNTWAALRKQASTNTDTPDENTIVKGLKRVVKMRAGVGDTGITITTEDAEASGYYNMHFHTDDVQMDVKIHIKFRENSDSIELEQSQINTDIFKLDTLPDNSRHILFVFNNLPPSVHPYGKPFLNQIYVEVVRVLQEQTNFMKLALQSDYLMSLARLLESGYYSINAIDRQAQVHFQQLAGELQLRSNTNVQLDDGDEVTQGGSLHLERSLDVNQDEDDDDDGVFTKQILTTDLNELASNLIINSDLDQIDAAEVKEAITKAVQEVLLQSMNTNFRTVNGESEAEDMLNNNNNNNNDNNNNVVLEADSVTDRDEL